jgi:dihydrofolate reductase
MTQHNPRIVLIAAMDQHRAIGNQNQLPWHLPDDLKFFKAQTQGGVVVMGRKTFESLGNRPLPNRRNIVLTRQTNWSGDGVEVAQDWSALMAQLSQDGVAKIWVIGGGEIYRLTLATADELVITQVEATLSQADTWFPEWAQADWVCAEITAHDQDERHFAPFQWQKWLRIC